MSNTGVSWLNFCQLRNASVSGVSPVGRPVFAATIPEASPSMRLDHLARRRSEIDVINGQVAELSREAGFEAPYNETLCAILRGRESRFPDASIGSNTVD